MDDGMVTFSDWPAKRDAIRAALAAREPRLEHTGPLRLSDSAVVEHDSITAPLLARRAFLEIAADVQPQLLVELAGEPLDQWEAAWEAAGGPTVADPLRPEVGLRNSVLLPVQRAMVERDGALWRWCERWGLPVWDEMAAVALGPGDRSLMHFTATAGWGLLDGAATVCSWRLKPFRPDRPYGFVAILHESSLASSLVADRDLGVAAHVDLPRPQWDPQRETEADAIKRIRAEQHRATLSEMERIRTEAHRIGVAAPVKRIRLEHLAWLARYQFRGESFPAIARDAPAERQAVTKAIKAAAKLIGLTLRKPNPPGRPRKAD